MRLDGIIVLDVDTQDPVLIARLEQGFGPAQVKVLTPRGMHLYYAAGGAIPVLRAEKLPVDVKIGPHAFVVGPYSCRPDGGRYTYLKGRIGEVELTPLRMHETAITGTTTRQHKLPDVGNRHISLRAKALKMVQVVDTLDELNANLEALRDGFPDP